MAYHLPISPTASFRQGTPPSVRPGDAVRVLARQAPPLPPRSRGDRAARQYPVAGLRPKSGREFTPDFFSPELMNAAPAFIMNNDVFSK
jgi:hypothetical protein